MKNKRKRKPGSVHAFILHGNAIVLDRKGNAFTWDEKRKTLEFCPGHMSRVKCIAICRAADERFAASYSDERYHADKSARRSGRAKILDNKKIVRVRIVKIGQCQWRLPTEGRTIRRLQFFTANRIVLAGFAENGDILLWELINKMVDGEERGRWEVIEIVHENPLSPVECAVPEDKKTFISAYSDGSILIRGFEKGRSVKT